MIKVRCRKELGTWFYDKLNGDDCNELDAPVYSLYDDNGKFVHNFGSYGDMKYYIETGIILC